MMTEDDIKNLIQKLGGNELLQDGKFFLLLATEGKRVLKSYCGDTNMLIAMIERLKSELIENTGLHLKKKGNNEDRSL